MEIKYLDYVMQDCEGDLHLLYRQTLNENNAVTKQLWEEGNERETPPKGSWSRVADQYLLEIHPKMPTWSLFQPHEILRYWLRYAEPTMQKREWRHERAAAHVLR